MEIRNSKGQFITSMPKELHPRYKHGQNGVLVSCPYCGVGHRIKPSRYRANKIKKFYCCREHQKLDCQAKVTCEVCGRVRQIHKSDFSIEGRGRFCSKKCARAVTPKGSMSPQWKGGRTLSDGYVLVYDVNKRRYVAEHRVIMKVDDHSLHVHHRNGNRADNRKGNLQVLTVSEHMTLENNIRWGNVTRDKI